MNDFFFSQLLCPLGFYFYVSQAGIHVADPVQQVFNGQEVEVWPLITWKPRWALTFSDVKRKVSGSSSISQRSTLVIKGPNIFLKDLCLDGAIVIDAIEVAEVCLNNNTAKHQAMIRLMRQYLLFYIDSLYHNLRDSMH